MEPTPLQNGEQRLPDNPPSTTSGLRVVGIGASSGGLRALKNLFATMPVDTGMAFVVILHLSPEHESHAASVLQHATTMPVTQVTETVPIVPNHIYVIPPNKYLSLTDSTLQLSALEEPRSRRAPIDLFFRTLAETHGRNAAAIVLSGSGADGAIGVQRIKENGGVVLAQDPQEAEFDSMPRNAIVSGLVDFVQPAAALPASLIAYWNSGDNVRLPSPEAPRPEADTDVLREIFSMLRTRTGHDFSQ